MSTEFKSSRTEEEQQPDQKPIAPRTYESFQHKAHHFYLSDEIKEPVYYVDMIHRIRSAGPDETVYIYLNTPGGILATGIQIISAINSSHARIVTVLEGEVCSLGSILFLCGDDFVVHDHCLLMIHNFSGGTSGKGHEQAAQIEAQVKWFTKMAKDIYTPFLSDAELRSVIDGKDIWLDSDQVRSRLTKMIKHLHKEQKNALKKKTNG